LSSDDDHLTFFECEILVLVGRDGAGPHDLVRMARQGRMYSNAADSQFYATPKRLEQRGYLTSTKEPGRTHPRTHYMLTKKAYDALRVWIAQPAPFPRTDTSAITRMIAADLVGERAVAQSVLAMRDEIGFLLEQLDDAEVRARALPHREKYLLLAHGLARRILLAHREWLDEVERELEG
jgi:DNA-binding PadR family transcriptional regulator